MTPNDKKSQTDELDFVERVATALERSTSNDVPSPQAINATILELQKLDNSPELVQKDLDCTVLNSRARRNQGRNERILRIFRLSGLAAAIMLLMVGAIIFSQLNRSTAFAFDTVVENIKKSKSASYSFIIKCEKYKLDQGKKKLVQKFALHQKVYNQGDLVRVDCLSIPGTKTTTSGLCIGSAYPLEGAPPIELQPVKTEATFFFDHQSAKAVFLMHANKKAYRDNISAGNEANAEQAFGQYSAEGIKSNITKIIAGDSKNKPERIADEIVNGKNTRVFIIKNSDSSTGLVDLGKVWFDIDTGLPLKLEAEGIRSNPDGSEEKNSIVMEDFKWNETLATSLFDADIPQDFKVIEQNVTDKTIVAQEPDSLPLFKQLIEQIRKATSVRFTMVQMSKKTNGPEGTEVRVEDRYQCLKTKGRHERHVADEKGEMHFTELFLIDGKDRLDINNIHKTAQKRTNQIDDLATDLLEGFGSLADAKFTGEETLNGKKTHLYQFAKLKDFNDGKMITDYVFDKDEYLKIWIDPVTRFPVRLESKMKMSDDFLKPISIEVFEWNIPLDEKLFKFEVPEGYKVTVEEEKKLK